MSGGVVYDCENLCVVKPRGCDLPGDVAGRKIYRLTETKLAYARPMYWPVRVSTLINSPSLIKSGTLTEMPVSSFASF